MNTIFIEAEKKETAEHYFLTALMAKYFPEVPYELIPMAGVANLFNEANLNQLRSKTAEGINCLAKTCTPRSSAASGSTRCV